MLFNIIMWAFFGSLVGWIASKASGSKARMSAGANISVGIIGAILGGYSIDLLGIAGGGFTLTGLIVAILGAIILLLIASFVWPKNRKNQAKPDQEKRSPTSPEIIPKVVKQSLQKATTKKAEPGIIFLSYRRADSEDIAGRIYDRLREAFGKVAVFKDVDSIPLGLDFKEYLDEKVGECNILLAIIGDRWLETRDSTGKRRLENPSDFVRIEIESALARDIPVIPLLVRGTSIPSEEELPGSLKKLAYRNGMQIRPDPDFHRDMDRLISNLEGYVKSRS